MDFGGTSVSGPRPYNEDTYLLKDLSGYASQLGGLKAFIMVSDGMGGHESGDVASRLAVQAAESYIDDLLGMAATNALDLEPAIALTEIVAEAHQAIVTAAAEAGGSSMGATFVGAFVSEQRAWIGHVGDSRAYLIRKGEGRQLTIDHSAVGRMIAEGVLTEEQAQNHPQRNVIEKALGFDGAEAEVDLVDLDPGDVLVLCSDGLSTVLSGSDMAGIVGAAANAQYASASLDDEAIKAGTDDNTTAVVWCDDWSMFKSLVPKGRESRKAASAARRAAGRHRNAQSSSLWIAGALGVAALVMISFGVLASPKAGTVSKDAGRVTSPPPSTTDTRTPPSKPTPEYQRANRLIAKKTTLRLEPTKGSTAVAVVQEEMRVFIDSKANAKDSKRELDKNGDVWTWYPVSRTWLEAKYPAGSQLTGLKPASGFEVWSEPGSKWPKLVWVRGDLLKATEPANSSENK
jgi:serine/threonine protein phosphatase PrpC